MPKLHGSPPSEYTLYWTFFHSSRFLSSLRLPWKKNRVALKIFTVANILFTFRIFNNMRLPWKQSFPWNFLLHWIHFLLLYSGFLSNCPCPEKESCPENFHCIEYNFYIQQSWTTCACPEKQRVPWIFHCIEIHFVIQDFEQLALPSKTELPWKFSLYGVYFLHSDFLSNLRSPLKTAFAPEFVTVFSFFKAF